MGVDKIGNSHNIEVEEKVKKLEAEILRLKTERENIKNVADSFNIGVAKIFLNEQLSLEFVSEGYCRMFGYTKSEYLKKNSLLHFIPKNRQRLLFDFFKSLGNDIKVFECELIKKDGARAYALIKARKVLDEKYDCPIIQVVVEDITHYKNAEEELLSKNKQLKILNEENSRNRMIYRSILENSSAIFFEVNAKYGFVEINEDRLKQVLFMTDAEIKEKGVLKALADKVIPDDQPKFLRVLRLKEEERRVEFRVLNFKNEEVWFELIVMPFKSEDGTVKSLFAQISNIDSQKNKIQELYIMAQRDSLTNLKNRMTTQQEINDFLSDNVVSENNHGAMLMIDIDDFKSLNDTYGHLTGDVALKRLSRFLEEICRSDDIVGRTGGDEFVVFLKNVDTKDTVKKRVDKIFKFISKPIKDKKAIFNINVSIGISFAQKGDTFYSLWEKADYALYKMKKQGKNGYVFYEEEDKSDGNDTNP